MKKPMIVEKEIPIMAYDIDVMGIVSNTVYVRWFEDLRHILLEDLYPYREMIESNQSPILIRTEVDYKLPLTIYDLPIGRCWMTSIGKSRWELGFEIVSPKAVHCLGRQVGCFYDMDKQRPIPLPKKIVTAFERGTEH